MAQQRKPRTITGRKKLTQRELGRGGVPHHEGWDAALEDALKKKLKWDPGDYDKCRIEFEAKIHVENPGTITEYRAIVHPPGG
jgi:hypothetical protein